VSMDERQRRIDDFNDHRAQVALCSLQAMGHGVNLTAANHVIHVDRWWNPAVEDQATDRVHRIGQEKTVFVHRILTSDTLEEKIATLQERKRGLSDDVMGAAAQQQLRWTREELLELLKPLD
jgi:SNF2 family DNA or RNA helicase